MKSVVTVLRVEQPVQCSHCNAFKDVLFHHIPKGWLCGDCFEINIDTLEEIKPEYPGYNPQSLGGESITI